MRFAVEHRFPAPVAVVEAALTDPGFYSQLDLPDLDRPEVLDREVDGPSVTLRMRFTFVGHLDPIAHRVLGHRTITWVQEIRIDTEGRTGELRVTPDFQAERLRFSGGFELVADGDETLRRLRGELSVRVPLVARVAERRIGPGLLRRLDLEADALAAHLRA